MQKYIARKSKLQRKVLYKTFHQNYSYKLKIVYATTKYYYDIACSA